MIQFRLRQSHLHRLRHHRVIPHRHPRLRQVLGRRVLHEAHHHRHHTLVDAVKEKAAGALVRDAGEGLNDDRQVNAVEVTAVAVIRLPVLLHLMTVIVIEKADHEDVRTKRNLCDPRARHRRQADGVAAGTAVHHDRAHVPRRRHGK